VEGDVQRHLLGHLRPQLGPVRVEAERHHRPVDGRPCPRQRDGWRQLDQVRDGRRERRSLHRLGVGRLGL